MKVDKSNCSVGFVGGFECIQLLMPFQEETDKDGERTMQVAKALMEALEQVKKSLSVDDGHAHCATKTPGKTKNASVLTSPILSPMQID